MNRKTMHVSESQRKHKTAESEEPKVWMVELRFRRQIFIQKKFIFLFTATPVAYGNSRAGVESEPHVQPMPQLAATLDPSPAD